MGSKGKNSLIDDLESLGLINNRTKEHLNLSFEDYLKGQRDNEIELLKEVIRIKKKKEENKNELTFIEESFYNYVLKSCY